MVSFLMWIIYFNGRLKALEYFLNVQTQTCKVKSTKYNGAPAFPKCFRFSEIAGKKTLLLYVSQLIFIKNDPNSPPREYKSHICRHLLHSNKQNRYKNVIRPEIHFFLRLSNVVITLLILIKYSEAQNRYP